MKPIEAKGLCKAFPSGPVLQGVELSVVEGGVYGLLGRNGAGKTTLLRLLMGLMHPDDGVAAVLGQNLARGCPPAKTHVAYVGQGEMLPAWARIDDLIRFDAALRATWEATSLMRWLDAEGLALKRRVSTMSVGQRKRLELELALAGSPKVFLADEPFAGLDPVSRAELIEHLLGYAASNTVSIILSSHILGDLERICDRVGLLARGVIAYEAPMDQLKEQTAIVAAAGATPPERTPSSGTPIAARAGEDSCTWVMSGVFEQQAASLEAEGFNVSRGSLEELGVELIRCLDPR